MIGNAIVVGAGIGGLAAALALHRNGWHVQILEQATEIGEVGAGLSVWPNGVRALDALGLGEQVRARAMVETRAGIRNVRGRWLSRTDIAELDRRYGPLVMIHRAHLLDVLREAVPAASLRVGARVTSVRADGQRTEVRLAAQTLRADLVVAADGIHSTVRQALWPQAAPPRYAGYTAWRLLVAPPRRLNAGGETWGRGERMGIAQLPDGQVYMFGIANAPEGARGPDGELAELRRRFGHWHEPIPALLAAASPDAVMRHDLYELPPLESYVSGKVALLGDAAHAMTPNLGQGANQALEDAVTLAAVLEAGLTVESALADYDRVRRPRTQEIALRSHRLGVVAQWEAAPAAALRNGLLALMPSGSLLRSLHPVLTWRPGIG